MYLFIYLCIFEGSKKIIKFQGDTTTSEMAHK